MNDRGTGRGNRREGRGSVVLGLAIGLFAASGGLLGTWLFLGGDTATRNPAADADNSASAPKTPTPAAVIAATAGDNVTLHMGERSMGVTWGEIGLGEDGFDRDGAAAALAGLKATLDTTPKNARMDLRGHQIYKEKPGLSIDVPAAAGVLEAAALAGAVDVELPSLRVPAEVTVADLGIDDISHVLATFTTRFAIREKSRNYNLKQAASHLDGYVLKPGELFSFNEVVGARTEEEGYKIAHVILGGEMVDGQAGGTCQISTTLHGAAFFAGIEIVKSRPHSRPSTYVAMGLDATVVYPATDLKLRNTYDFPVVISYRVARGESNVEILGKQRPYDKIVFEREVTSKIEFDTVTREDENIAMGYMVVDQLGFPGYKVNRLRKYYKDGALVKTDKWRLNYRPVTEYVRTGANPDPNMEPPGTHKPHGPKPPGDGTYSMAQ